jgi:hypothetical protein
MISEWQQGFLCVPHNTKFCDQCNIAVKFSTNSQWVGKTKKIEIDGIPRQTYEGKIVSLGKKWQNAEMSLEEMFEAVAGEGFAIAPELTEDEFRTRSERTFKSHQVVLVDVDKGMTIEELQTNKFFLKYGSGYYTSPSHKEKHHKFRIIFVLEQPMTNADRLRKLYTGLIQIFGGDEACKDGARLFFGTINAQRKSFDCSKRLPEDKVQLIVSAVQANEEADMKASSTEPHTPPTDKSKAYMLDLLGQCYCGNYDIWFGLAAAMKHSGYTFEDFVSVSVGHLMNKKTKADCKQVWNGIDGNSRKPATFGTLVWFVRSKLGDEIWKTTIDKRADMIALATGVKK